jgi:hypothetical protein
LHANVIVIGLASFHARQQRLLQYLSWGAYEQCQQARTYLSLSQAIQ